MKNKISIIVEGNWGELEYLKPTREVSKEVNKILKLLTNMGVDREGEGYLNIKIRKGRQILEQYIMNVIKNNNDLTNNPTH